MSESISIPSRFNGPLQSGNGGYSAGAIAPNVGGDVAEVSLRSPVPLDTELAIDAAGDGSIRISDGETLVAEARSVDDLGVEPPQPVSLEAAREAAGRYRGQRGGQFSRCFVCGLDREDSLGVFAGEVVGREMVASPWTPPEWAADGDGLVRPEIVWGVLDCPTYFAAYLRREELPVGFLVRQATRIDAPVKAGEEHVVVAWPLESDGRKSEAASAVLSADGETLAIARALLVEPAGTSPASGSARAGRGGWPGRRPGPRSGRGSAPGSRGRGG
ncbi:MAG TPA: hypothetical protein VNO20_11835 [Solirubrobacterales bacterium]|nr:hypothetical protein [Solirubrobacterales bacterium]